MVVVSGGVGGVGGVGGGGGGGGGGSGSGNNGGNFVAPLPLFEFRSCILFFAIHSRAYRRFYRLFE